MFVILKPEYLKDFNDNTYDRLIIRIKEKEFFDSIMINEKELIDIRIPSFNVNRSSYNTYQMCKIIKSNKTKLEIALQYKKYSFSRINEIRKEKIENILKEN